MSRPAIRRSTPAEHDAIVALLGDAGLMWRDIDRERSIFFVAESNHRIVGTVRLELSGAAALLGSLYVAPDSRGSGIGGMLVSAAESAAREAGMRHVYLFSTGAGPYFERLGYGGVPVDEAVAACRDAPQVEWYVAHPDELGLEVTFAKALA